MARASSGGFFHIVLGILFILGVKGLWILLTAFWDEYNGAFGRWRRGEPIRASALHELRWREQQQRLSEERGRVKRAYAANHNLILAGC